MLPHQTTPELEEQTKTGSLEIIEEAFMALSLCVDVLWNYSI